MDASGNTSFSFSVSATTRARLEMDATCVWKQSCRATNGDLIASWSALAHLKELACANTKSAENDVETSPAPSLAKFMKPCKHITAVAAKHAASEPLAGHVIVLLHHLTREVLGTIEALRQLGCRDIVCFFSGYNPTATDVFGPELAVIPDGELSTYKLSPNAAADTGAETSYVLDRKLLKRPGGSEAFDADAMDAALAGRDYLSCARTLASYVALEALGRCAAGDLKLLIVEDGGYVAPLFNAAALDGTTTVGGYRKRHNVPADGVTDARLGGASAAMEAVVGGHLAGSTEHTRNGYDKVQSVALRNGGRLARPCLTIAISYEKTQAESISVAMTCLNSIECAMLSYGSVLRRRNVCVLGCRGNIGGRSVGMFANRVAGGAAGVCGVDLKVALTVEEPTPEWQPSALTPTVEGVREVERYADLPAATRRNVDLIFGMTGGRSEKPGSGAHYETLTPADVDFWLQEGTADVLWLASGSTKTKEFESVQAFVEGLAAKGTHVLGGKEYAVLSVDHLDVLSQRDFGQIFRFTPKDGGPPKELVSVTDWKPVNFMFYGVPTEDIDPILAQLLDITVRLVQTKELTPRMYAVDYHPIATNGIQGAQGDLDVELPLPKPTGF